MPARLGCANLVIAVVRWLVTRRTVVGCRGGIATVSLAVLMGCLLLAWPGSASAQAVHDEERPAAAGPASADPPDDPEADRPANPQRTQPATADRDDEDATEQTAPDRDAGRNRSPGSERREPAATERDDEDADEQPSFSPDSAGRDRPVRPRLSPRPGGPHPDAARGDRPPRPKGPPRPPDLGPDPDFGYPLPPGRPRPSAAQCEAACKQLLKHMLQGARNPRTHSDFDPSALDGCPFCDPFPQPKMDIACWDACKRPRVDCVATCRAEKHYNPAPNVIQNRDYQECEGGCMLDMRACLKQRGCAPCEGDFYHYCSDPWDETVRSDNKE